MDNKELVWIEKEFVEEYKLLESDANKNEQILESFKEYMKTVTNESRTEFRAQY